MYLSFSSSASLAGSLFFPEMPPWVSSRSVCSFSQTAADNEGNQRLLNVTELFNFQSRFYVKLKCWPTLVTVMLSDIIPPGWNMLQLILLVLLCPVSDMLVLVHISWRLLQHTAVHYDLQARNIISILYVYEGPI